MWNNIRYLLSGREGTQRNDTILVKAPIKVFSRPIYKVENNSAMKLKEMNQFDISPVIED